MWYPGGGWGWGGGLVLLVFTVLLFAVLIAGVIALVHYLAGSRSSHQPGPPPASGEPGWGGRRAEDLLAERFARGEIDEEEYKRRVRLLREHR